MELALGTAQFGLSYGIANSHGRIERTEATKILEYAYAAGIRRLDTAPAYGDIEENLPSLCGSLDFEIVSKVPAIDPKLSVNDAVTFVQQFVKQSCDRLGTRLTGMLFHDVSNLAGARGQMIWQAALKISLSRGLKLGSSGYDAAEITKIGLPGFAMAQLPGNAFDQRVQSVRLQDVELTLRSAFLQGLLLMKADAAAFHVPISRSAMDHWLSWCNQHELAPLQAAFAVVKGLGSAQYCVIGVDSVDQLATNVKAWQDAGALLAPELAVNDAQIFDPRLWPRKAGAG